MEGRDDPRDPREPPPPPPPPPPPAPLPIEPGPIDPPPPIEPPPPGGAQGPDPDADIDILPPDSIGDIPPPPVPRPPRPRPITGPGIGGIPGTEAGTLAQPGTRGAVPFRTAAFAPQRPPRFGPGSPIVGGGTGITDGTAGGLSQDEAAELLRALAAARTPGQ